MKKFSLLISALALFFAVSCVQETQEQVQPEKFDVELIEMSFEACLGGQTKVEVGTPVDGGYKTFWSPEDAIYVYALGGDLADNSAYIFTCDLDQASASATFTGCAPAADEYYAIYTASGRDHVWDPSTKTIMLDGVAYDAVPDNKFCPVLVAKAENGKLSFQHLTGYFKFTVPDSDLPIERISLNTKDAKLMCADANFNLETMQVEEILSASAYAHLYPAEGEEVIAPGTYYYTLLCGELEEGFCLEFYNTEGLRYMKSTDIPVKIKAGEIINLGVVDDVRFDYPISSVADVLVGSDGEYYRVSGYVTMVENAKYGNWWLKDENGDELYIYGTINEFGVYQLQGLKAGDFVTVQGPRFTYGTTIELQDVSIVDVKHNNVVTILSTSWATRVIGSMGEDITVDLEVSGEDFEIVVPEELAGLITVVKQEEIDGCTRVTFRVAENNGQKYTARITFKAKGQDGEEYWTATEFTQNPKIREVTAAEFNNASDEALVYWVTGCVSDIVHLKYGNLYVRDYTGEIYVYGTYDTSGRRFDSFETPVNVGDIISVVEYRDVYGGEPQMKNAIMREHIPVQAVSIANLATLGESSDAYYRVKGKVVSIRIDDDSEDETGLFTLMDETGSVEVDGLAAGWGGERGNLSALNIKLGDTVTLTGQCLSDGGSVQIQNAFYVTHESFDPEEDTEGDVE